MFYSGNGPPAVKFKLIIHTNGLNNFYISEKLNQKRPSILAKTGRNKSASFLHKVQENEPLKPKRDTRLGSSKISARPRHGRLFKRLVKLPSSKKITFGCVSSLQFNGALFR